MHRRQPTTIGTLFLTALVTLAGAATPTDEQGFLAAIAASPEDDTIRLAYADFIEERGRDVRAEFIRLQVKAARLTRTSPTEAGELKAKADALLKTHEAEWLPPGLHARLLEATPVNSPSPLRWERGFPAYLTLSDVVLVVPDFHAGLDRLEPAPAVGISFGGVSMYQHVSHATFHAYSAKVGLLRRVRSVILSGDVDIGAIADISDHFTSMIDLRLYPNQGVPGVLIGAFTGRETARRLRSLSLVSRHQDVPGVLHSLAHANLPNLHALHISVQPDNAEAGVQLVDTLDTFRAGSGLSNLEELRIQGLRSEHALSGFIDSDRFRRLRRIHFTPPHYINVRRLAELLERTTHNLVEIQIDGENIDETAYPKLAAQLKANRAKFPESAETCALLTKHLSDL